jgi:hypothetical protein
LGDARRIDLGQNMMSEKSKPSRTPHSESAEPVEEGLRLMGIFRKIQNPLDRQKVIALAERLLDEQNTG